MIRIIYISLSHLFSPSLLFFAFSHFTGNKGKKVNFPGTKYAEVDEYDEPDQISGLAALPATYGSSEVGMS